MNLELLRRIQSELFLHSWPAYPIVEGRVIVSCACGKHDLRTGPQWVAHIAEDVMPKFLQATTSS